jgi:phosphoribosylanthranilate isomerase
MTKVKICGITNLEDALLSVRFGTDALGFNFYQKSPRYILPEDAKEIIDNLPDNILNVGVFVNEEQEKIIEIAKVANLDAIQLHGEETPELAKELKSQSGLEIIKAFRVSKGFKTRDILNYQTDAVLLDTFSVKEHGGTGETFDWEIAKKAVDIFPKVYLAGGLSPNNVVNAISRVKPFAVDSCSGLETRKGKKDKVKTINFLSNITFFKEELWKNKDILNILRLFRSRPRLHLYNKSLTQLCSFICGYYSALDGPDSDFNSKDNLFRRFDNWLDLQRGMFISGIYSYSQFFLEKCNGDEELAFDVFFACLEEFLLEDLTNEQL